ncbi:MAG TPA: hypothetical protein VNP73_07565 [Actinomycetota bacterium]|nr:hypothetical protein [Actinomycetota bacterium]
MDAAVGVAGLICVLMAFGHHAIGVVWVLPHVTEESVPPTPFGRSSMTVAMLRVTWYIVTVFVLAFGAILMTLAWAEAADARTVLLRSFAVMWLAAAAMAIWVAWQRVHSLRGLFRLPVPFMWVVVALLCWWAST